MLDFNRPVHFVINRTDAIGDLVLSLPVAYFLKKFYPNCEVTFITSQRNLQIINHCPYVDGAILYKENFSDIYKRFREWKKGQELIYIYLGGSHIPSVAAVLGGISKRFGLIHKPLGKLLNHGLRQSRSRVITSEKNYNLMLIKDLLPGDFDFDDKISSPLISFHDADNEKKKIEENIKKFNFDNFFKSEKKVVIHPGMSGHTLNWPVRNYARLIKKIKEKFPEASIAVSYTKSDMKILDSFFGQLETDNLKLGKDIYDFRGDEWGIDGLVYLLAASDVTVAPSTGPLHVAAASGSKVVGLFSPIKTQSALRWGPLNICAEPKILVPDVVCGEEKVCAGSDCFYYECMSKVEVEKVFKNVSHTLR